MAPHSSILVWRIPGMGEPGGLSSMGSHRVGHDWSDLAAAAAWTVAHQAPLSMGFSRQEYWSGLPCPPPGNLPNPRIECMSLSLLHWQVGSLPLVPPGILYIYIYTHIYIYNRYKVIPSHIWDSLSHTHTKQRNWGLMLHSETKAKDPTLWDLAVTCLQESRQHVFAWWRRQMTAIQFSPNDFVVWVLVKSSLFILFIKTSIGADWA